MNKFEHTVVNIIAALSPWSAPAIPTYFTIHNALKYLLYGTEGDTYFVWILAIALEFVGLAAVHTVLEFWTWNKKHVDDGEKAPVSVAAFAALVYIVIVLTVNVVLELFPQSMYAAIFARGTLSVLTIPAMVIVGIRSQHARRLANEKEEDSFVKEEQAKDNETNRQIKLMKAQQRTEQLANEHPNEQPKRTKNERPSVRRTNIPQPANEQRTQNEPNEQHPFGFPKNEQMSKKEQLLAYIEQLQANGEAVPGPSELERRTGIRKGYISDVLNGKA